MRWHKGRLSTFHRAHKRRESLLRLITAQLMKEEPTERRKSRGGGGHHPFQSSTGDVEAISRESALPDGTFGTEGPDAEALSPSQAPWRPRRTLGAVSLLANEGVKDRKSVV